ncbi:NAD(P)/FAD-dependent oxidoreductase [Mesorhizobium sp. 113-3-3]|uniref:NAD(P)/FAD-dependent oxidoreductase n=1 Tax=Mesorhizobium sp. 113-3-3 TaxID=2744516 RepID=UPI0018EBAA9A|nr:FAD-binding oxidoreductase [Mesorhizobium sp. 113-3-3]
MNGFWRSEIKAPIYDESNGWFRALGVVPPARPLRGSLRSDWVIIGGGACGLATARYLALLKPRDSIALIEASRIGFGASGRNSGFMLDHNTHGRTKSEAVTRRNNALCSAGAELLREVVRTHSIPCDWSDWGRIYVSAGVSGDRHLCELQADFNRDNISYIRLERDQMARLVGTSFYRAGLKVGGNGLVNPAALMRGLAATLPPNVEVFEETCVRSWRSGPVIDVFTDQGEVRSKGVIFCTSVFSGEFGIARNRVAPIATFASLTSVIPDRLRSTFGDTEFAILPATENGSTIRLINGGRLLIRNCFSFREKSGFSKDFLASVQQRLRNAMIARWPQFASLEFTDTWSGLLGFTRNDGIEFGQVGANVYVNVSSDAAPVTRGTAIGKLLAEKICDIRSPLLELAETAPKAALLPPPAILRHVVNHRIRSFERLAREEF